MSFPPTLLELISPFQKQEKNPFPPVINFLIDKLDPREQEDLASGLLVSVVTYSIIALVCISIIFLPYFQGLGGHKRRIWFVRLKYLEGYRYPYWVLNSGLVVAVSHLVGSSLFFVFLGLRYHALKTGYMSVTLHESAWLELRWFPSYCSFFTQSWSTLFVWASNASLKGAGNRGLHPIIFNTNLVALPVLVFIFAMVIISGQVKAINTQTEDYQALLECLKLNSLEWEAGKRSFTTSNFKAAAGAYALFVRKSEEALYRIRLTGLFWTLMGVPTIIIYIFGVSTLLRVIKKRSEAVNDELEDTNASSQVNLWGKEAVATPPKKLSKLRSSFIYLGIHYLSMSITLLYHIITGLIYFPAEAKTFMNKEFQGLFLTLSNSGSYLLLTALVVQLLRIVCEGREQKVVAVHVNEKNAEYEESILGSRKKHPDISLMT